MGTGPSPRVTSTSLSRLSSTTQQEILLPLAAHTFHPGSPPRQCWLSSRDLESGQHTVISARDSIKSSPYLISQLKQQCHFLFPQIFLTWLLQAAESRNEPWLPCTYGDCAPLGLSLGVFKCYILECLTWQGQQGYGLRTKTPDTPFLITLPASVMLK